MKGSRFNKEQIIGILREHEAGAKTPELCRRHGISDATFYIYGRLPRDKKVSDLGLAMIQRPTDGGIEAPPRRRYRPQAQAMQRRP